MFLIVLNYFESGRDGLQFKKNGSPEKKVWETLLEELHERGIKALCVTMDGHAMSVCAPCLGVNIVLCNPSGSVLLQCHFLRLFKQSKDFVCLLYEVLMYNLFYLEECQIKYLIQHFF